MLRVSRWSGRSGARAARRSGHAPEFVEQLERRLLLSGQLVAQLNAVLTGAVRRAASVGRAHTNIIIQSVSPSATAPPGGALTPAQIEGAYGINQILFGSITGNGAGQTIAIVDAFHYPSALSDLQAFDAQFGLPDLAAYTGPGMNIPWFRQVAQDGSTNYPGTDNTGGWETEEALDIEWAHAVAPAANIILVEANSASDTDLIQTAVNWARNAPGVCAVSMSWSGAEYSGESSLDSWFTTPTGHSGVTFFAATGDTGQPSGYPAYSPNVVAVGGTTLNLSGNTYLSESGWNGSGGGVSLYEPQPAWQKGIVTQSSSNRANPDVAMDADPNSGVAVYDSFLASGGPWLQVGGTSLATPMWAGLMSIIDQGRAVNSLSPLDGGTQTLPLLYQLSPSDFHDITSGNNGFNAGPGYDLVTGLGSPVANLLVADMIVIPSNSPGTPILSPDSDTGISNTDNITSLDNSAPAKDLLFTIPNTIPGATVNLYSDGTLIGSALASGTSTPITTNGTTAIPNGVHSITAAQVQPGLGQSPASSALTLTVDTDPPSVSAQNPAGSIAGPVTDLRLSFNEAVDTTTFSLADITSFTDPTNNDLRGQITGFTWSAGNTILDIQFAAQSTVGAYQLTLGTQIVDLAGNTTAAPYTASFNLIAAVYAANMDSNPGWTFDAGSLWAWGQPLGLASHNNDPTSGHTGADVVGYNLSGDYPRGIPSTQYATTPLIDASHYQNLTFTFWRWLGVRGNGFANVQASPNGGATWTTLWSNNATTISDNAWVLQQFTLPTTFNGSSNILIRWGMGPTSPFSSTFPGWNIDDVLITGTRYASISGTVFTDANANGTLDAGESGIHAATVFLDLNNNGIYDAPATNTYSSTNIPVGIPDNYPPGVTSSLTVAGAPGIITNITITFNITHTYDSDLIGYLTAPDGTQLTLFSRVGFSGQNFSNTTLSDAASISITSGTAPFSGTYRPSPDALANFNGQSPNGTWLFRVADVAAIDVGTINSWSLNISSGEPAATTDANGNYSFNITAGAYTVAAIVPSGYIATGPLSHTLSVNTAAAGQNFALFPTSFSTPAANASYYLRLDPTGTLLQISNGSAPLATPTWQIPLTLLPSLAFNLSGAGDSLYVDFANGTPLPAGNLSLNGLAGQNDQLFILGQSPTQAFNMTDFQVGPQSDAAILYQNLTAVHLADGTFHYSGTLSTLQQLYVDTSATLLWS